MCFLLLLENRHLRKKWEWFFNERVRQEAVVDDRCKLWQYETVFSPFSYFMEHNWLRASDATLSESPWFCTEATFSMSSSLLLIVTFVSGTPWWGFELSFVNLKHVCPAFSHSLPQGLTCLTVWCSSSLFWLLFYCLLHGHFPHTVPAHSFLASSSWKTQTDTKVYA